MLRIFLAHASEDKVAVSHLYRCLEESGYQLWLNKEDLLPGLNWQVEIARAIKESQVFIVCLSQQSVTKQEYVQREFRMALNAYADSPPDSIDLIPVRLDDRTIPELRQEDYVINLRNIQWVDLIIPVGYETLTEALSHRFLDSPQATTSASAPDRITVHLGSGVGD